MERYVVHLRYYLGDSLEEIRLKDLEDLGKAMGVEVSFQRIDNRVFEDGMMREETLDRPLEEITQDVITISTGDEGKFRKALMAVYERYRSPRTTYGFWGSTWEAQRIAKELADETGGGW